MYTSVGRLLTSAFVMLLLLMAARRGVGQPTEQLSDAYRVSVRDEARQLVREIERLQDDIIQELDAGKARDLYRRADLVLDEAARFQVFVKPDVSRQTLYKAFDPLDDKLHDLLAALSGLDKSARAVQRSASRVRAADDALHYALSEGDVSPARIAEMTERQARVLAAAARDLERTGRYALGGRAGTAVLEGELRQLATAAEAFHKGLANKASPEQRRLQFAPVNQAWERVVHGLSNLKPQQHVYLIRVAGTADRLHQRLHRLLGVKGERPRLVIST